MYVISLVTLRGKRERAHMGNTGGTAGGELVSTVALGPEVADAKEVSACEIRGKRCCRRNDALGRESNSHRPDAHEG